MGGARGVFALSVGAAALSGLLFGFDTAVIAGVISDLSRVFALSAGGLGIVVSLALWGSLAGAFGVGAPGDRFGSRAVLKLMALFYLLGSLGCALAPNLLVFSIFRVLGGIAIGGSSVLAPVYITEIAPAAQRGRLVGCFQLSIVVGILLAYLSNAVIAGASATEMAWRWKLGVAAVPAAALFVLFNLIPQTPRWLMLKGRTTDAEAAAARLGISVPAVVPPVAPTLGRIDWALLRKPALLVITLASFNQLTGINAVLYYLNDIFASAGYGALSASWQAVVIGLVNLAFTLIGMSLVDRVGRRALLMAGGAGLANCLSVVAVVMFGYAPKSILLWALIGFIASFASSQGACVWVYMSEIFPQPIRAQGAAIGSATHWCMNAIVSAVFPMVAAVSTGAPFVFFALMMLAMMAFLTRLPETRGLALEEVALIY